MILTLKNKALLSILSSVKGIVPSRPTFPTQSMVLISPAEKGCYFYTQGQEAQIRYFSDELSIEKPEKKLISVAKVYEISRNFSEKSDIQLSFSKQSAQVSCEGSSYKLNCFPPDDFPVMNEADEKEAIELTEQDLKYLLEKTDFCIAIHDPRHFLNGLFFVVEDNNLSAVSTDSHRLALSAIPVSKTAKTEGILPREIAAEVKRLLSETEDIAKIAIMPQKIVVSLKNIQISAKGLNGQFPDYKKVIPKEFFKEIVLERETFLRSLQRASAILTSSLTKEGTHINLVFSEKKLLLKSSTAEGEEATVEQAIEYKGEPFEISFNSGYLQDVMKALDTKKICLQMRDAGSGARIVGEGSTTEEYVVMPLRL